MPRRPNKRWVPTGWRVVERGSPVIQWTLDLPIGDVAHVYREKQRGRWRWRLTNRPSQRQDGDDIIYPSAVAAAKVAEKAVKARLEASLRRMGVR